MVLTQNYQQQTGLALWNVEISGGDWKALCTNLRVNPKAAYAWVKSGAQERRPAAGGRRKALSEDQVDAVCRIIEEDPVITLKNIKERIWRISS